MPVQAAQWTGRWVTDHLGVRLDGDQRLRDLVGLAVRRNPRRAHLLVSGVLGKHVPATPSAVHAHGLELGTAVAAILEGTDAAVLGFAETATGLGHCVAEQLRVPYLHSTRRDVATAAELGVFEEEHSHATTHRLMPDDPQLLDAHTLVLVDDELSTGRTALNTIAALHALSPHHRYVLAALIDLRAPDDIATAQTTADRLGVRIDAVSLARGRIELPPALAVRASRLLQSVPEEPAPSGCVVRHPRVWPLSARESGRHGFHSADVDAARAAARLVAAGLTPHLAGAVHVLGTEELMYAPLLLAVELEKQGHDVLVSSTTRSPAHVQEDPGYPVRTAIAFDSHDGTPGRRYAYNVGGRPDVVVVVDEDADSHAFATGLVDRLRRRAERVHIVPVPTHRPLPVPLTGPAFGSYPATDVQWLLTDLSDVALEAPTEEREEAIQTGGAHYAESLPVEYQPDAAYRALFDAALTDSADRLAHAVGLVTELVLAERGSNVVLASLARAGTPVGVLMRRWALARHGVDLPHVTLSIVRGRGIDTVALRWLAAHHDPADVVFVDGWTGKGAIARELAAAIEAANNELGTQFIADLAVLADPGSCVSTFGTRDDFLIPSACLNSTVSGLVSRTVLNNRVLRPGQFHGAKFYAHLSADDVSRRFVDTIAARFDAVADAVTSDLPRALAADRAPTWAGRAQVETISAEYGIGDVTLVKPGVGETTRVLLRRVPWAVLADPGAGADLAHVRLLAAQRGVPVHDVAGLGYSCVGLIHPRYTRGATGSDGTAAG